MTTFYLDFEGGNDSNAGTSFALRWKTLTLGATGARLTAGDVIRIMGSPAPTSLGQTATWTDASDTVTLTSAVTADISDCSTAWTAATNVTASTDTSNRKEGAQSVSLACAAAFGTGRIGHFATGTLNLSAYQQVSFWIRVSGANQPANGLELRLCSDTGGVTAVNTIQLPALTSGFWWRVTVNTGGNLGSAIASVALYAAVDPGTVTILLDNIIACKAASSADSLTLSSFISPQSADDQPWYCINSIRGTTNKIGGPIAQAPNASMCKYYGNHSPSALVATTYKRESIKIAADSILEAGTVNLGEVQFVGGWNRTDMSTQDGVTWVGPSNGQVATAAALIAGGTGTSLYSIDKLYFGNVNFYAFWTATATTYVRFKEVGGAGGARLLDFSSSANTAAGTIIENLTFCTGYLAPLRFGASNTAHVVQLRAKKLYYGAANDAGADALHMGTGGFFGEAYAHIDEIKGFNNALFSEPASMIECFGTSFKDNTVDVNTNSGTGLYKALIRLINCTFPTGDPVLTAASDGPIEMHGCNGDMTDHRYYYQGTLGGTMPAIMRTASDRIHSSKEKNWKTYMFQGPVEHRPIERVIARAAVAADDLVTVNAWVYRDQTFAYARILIRPFMPGISETLVDAISTTNAWEELELTFTPTVKGTFEVIFQAWLAATGGGEANVWLDDISIDQSAGGGFAMGFDEGFS